MNDNNFGPYRVLYYLLRVSEIYTYPIQAVAYKMLL